jgi:threonine synthase
MEISCKNCGRKYPSEGLPYLCPDCGGLFDFTAPFQFDTDHIDPKKPGIWRYSHTFGLNPDFEPISLGEGNTPLLWVNIFGRKIAFKCEYQNPSGSFKDRGSAVIAAWLRYRGQKEAVEDSSGNAGASFAAYAAWSGIKARIFVPESAGGPKRRQIEAYGAELVSVPGSRKNASDAARLCTDKGVAYASHAYLPFNLTGYATISYEIFDQLGNNMPGAVIMPAGQGGLLLGVSRGFEALSIANSISQKPILIGVQAKECAPMWKMFTNNKAIEDPVSEKQTLAEGVQVAYPVRADAVLQAVKTSQGLFCTVEENEIIRGRNMLGRMGIYVEPTSAIVMSALENNMKNLPDPIVVILTGSGLKFDHN